jgi:hypothetical protein
MKNIYKFFLALGVCTSAFSQITEITKLPVQDISQSIKESAPVWLSENEIMIFYVNQTKDTIFSTKSTNRGDSWNQQKFQFKLDSLAQIHDLLYPTAVKTRSGRLIFAWSVFGIGAHLTYSDNNGENWSPVQIIYNGEPNPTLFDKSLRYLKLSQLDDDRVILCYNNSSIQNKLLYELSSDDGESWNELPNEIAMPGGYDHSIISINSTRLICIFKLRRTSYSGNDVYLRFSNDSGATWGDTVNISGYTGNLDRPRITKDEKGNIWLAYLRIEVVSFETNLDFTVRNIFYKKSTDGGISWSNENQLTHYIGDDNFPSMSTSGNVPFITYSTVKFTNIYQIVYGILGETVETYTPPCLFYSYSPFNWEANPDSFVVNVYVKDDVAVELVEFIFRGTSVPVTLFDDGVHRDNLAGDGIYGNTLYFTPEVSGNSIYLNVNKLGIPFSNKGVIAAVAVMDTSISTFRMKDIENNVINFKQKVVARFAQGGRYEEGAFLFSGGFFLSGISNGIMFTNAVASASLVEDYLPGIVNSNSSDQLFNFYVVNKDDNPFSYSWQRWKDAVLLGAEFYDGDGDGIYNPVDKNWNGTWEQNEDMPLLLGDITAWCIYNDALPKNMRRWNTVDPQGIEIRQTVFAVNEPELENVVFIKYNILNTGSVAEVLDSVYYSVWEDVDIGDATDDVAGCDTLLQSGFFYGNYPDQVYGDNPPSFFTSLLQGPIVNTNNPQDTAKNNLGELLGSEKLYGAKNLNITSYIFYLSGVAGYSDPNNAVEARNYLLGKNSQGNFVNPCTFPYCEVRGGINCSEVNKVFWASGDPVTNVGWISTQNRDTRNLVSTGPFELEKDKPQEIIIAYVIGRGTDPLNSIIVARENVQRAIQEYESNFTSMTYTPPPAIPVTSYLLYQNYPNPFNPTTTIRYELPQDGIVTIEVFDILGQRVITLINEFQKADRYEITMSSTGLASGVYIYQLRVNDFITSKKMVLVR